MPVSAETYEQLALEDGDVKWELVCGRLREKPGMTAQHYSVMRTLARGLVLQLGTEFQVAQESGRLRISTGTYYVPDVCVIPTEYVQQARRERARRLEIYDEAIPLVVEVWSPSTGTYDVDAKLKEYQLRGDLEIWRIHPYDQTLTAWGRQPDGSYAETHYTGGTVQPATLPGVAIDLPALFE